MKYLIHIQGLENRDYFWGKETQRYTTICCNPANAKFYLTKKGAEKAIPNVEKKCSMANTGIDVWCCDDLGNVFRPDKEKERANKIIEQINQDYKLLIKKMNSIVEKCQGKKGYINTTNTDGDKCTLYAYEYSEFSSNRDEVQIAGVKYQDGYLYIACTDSELTDKDLKKDSVWSCVDSYTFNTHEVYQELAKYIWEYLDV